MVYFIVASFSLVDCAFAKDKKIKEGFYKTGSMNVARDDFSATLLNDGRVFVAGGKLDSSDKNGRAKNNGEYLKSTEIYDPKTGEFAMGPDMAQPRFGHQAYLLTDGKILLVGGYTKDLKWNLINPSIDTYTDNLTIEIYDPIDNKFKKSPDLFVEDKIDKTTFKPVIYSVQIKDGRILFIYCTKNKKRIKIYNPVTSKFDFDIISEWNKIPLFSTHSAIPLHNNQILYFNHMENNTDEIYLYDIDKQETIKGPSRKFSTQNPWLINIGNDNILILGGTNDSEYTSLLDAEICNIKQNTCIPVKSKLKESNRLPLLIKMDSDNILILKVGYYDKLNSLVEKYSVKENNFYNNNIRIPQHFSQAVKLKDGEILCLGGKGRVVAYERLKSPLRVVGMTVTLSLLEKELINPLSKIKVVNDCYIYKY